MCLQVAGPVLDASQRSMQAQPAVKRLTIVLTITVNMCVSIDADKIARVQSWRLLQQSVGRASYNKAHALTRRDQP